MRHSSADSIGSNTSRRIVAVAVKLACSSSSYCMGYEESTICLSVSCLQVLVECPVGIVNGGVTKLFHSVMSMTQVVNALRGQVGEDDLPDKTHGKLVCCASTGARLWCGEDRNRPSSRGLAHS